MSRSTPGKDYSKRTDAQQAVWYAAQQKSAAERVIWNRAVDQRKSGRANLRAA